MSIKRHDPGPRLSDAVVHNGTAYLSGQVAEKTSVGVEEQTADVLRQIDALLAALGTSKARLLSATVYLADMATFGEMNRAWEAWVDKAAPPARATVQAKLAGPEWLVEIQAIAAVD